MHKLDQVSIRRQNLYRLWKAVQDCPGVTRQELARRTGLSLMSVTNLVDCLEARRALSFYRAEGPRGARPGAGRRADNIALSDENHMWAMLDLTDIHFRYAALTVNMRAIRAADPFPYDAGQSYARNFADFLEATRRDILELLESRELIGVAVVVPGPYDVKNDAVNNMRVPQINALRLKETLRARMGDYRYYIDEDVKFAVRAYMPPESAGEDGMLYYLYIGEGVGGAAALGDTVIRGLNAVAGDAGQMRAPQGDTYENLVSLRAFSGLLGLDARDDARQDERMNDISAFAGREPAAYKAAILVMAQRVARMLYGVLWMLDPSRIVIDCQYASWAADDFLNGVRGALADMASGALPRLPECLLAPLAVPAVRAGAIRVIGKVWIGQLFDSAPTQTPDL